MDDSNPASRWGIVSIYLITYWREEHERLVRDQQEQGRSVPFRPEGWQCRDHSDQRAVQGKSLGSERDRVRSKNSGNDARYELKTASNGKFHFNLKAANGQVIGTSQLYATEASRDKGVASVKTNGASTQVKDLT